MHRDMRRAAGWLGGVVAVFALVWAGEVAGGEAGLSEGREVPSGGGVQVPSESVADEAVPRIWARLVDPFSPFEEVVLESMRFGSSSALSVERRHPSGYGAERRTVLLDGDELARLALRLQQCIEAEEDREVERGGEGADEEGAGPLRRMELEVEGTRERRLVEEVVGGRSGHPCMAVLRGALASFDGVASYAPPFWEEGEYGWLTVLAPDAHRVLINGRDSGMRAPAYRMRVEPGRHRVALVDDVNGVVEEAEVLVSTSVTTVLRLMP